MDLNQVEKPLDQFLHNLPKSIRVEEVIIFGSYLEGNTSEDSDIDVYVVSEDFKNQDEDQRLRALYKAARFIEPEVHPWGVTSKELKTVSRLTTLGYARESGIRFLDRRR